jgi:cytochrome b subunit of formate dehydrogenase
MFFDLQAKTCGGCHPDDLATYEASIHGHGLSKMGLLVIPTCADCHGSHGIYRPLHPRSTLYSTRIAHTCGKCHRFIEERLQKSVHGKGSEGNGVEAGGFGTRTAPGGRYKRKATCTTCHQKHDVQQTDSGTFRQQEANRCGNCHADLSSRYAMSIHGELTELGYSAAAKCADCHGAHDILPVNDPESRLSPDRRAETCRQCHPNASGNFLKFDPHSDHTDAERSPLVHAVYTLLLTLLFTVFGFFGLHSLLWFIRGLVEVVQHGRATGLRPGVEAYVRFNSFHRVGHSLMMVSFLGLALTGLPLKYSHADWAKGLAQAMGGFGSTGFWHRFFAIVTFGCFLTYIVRLARLYLGGRRDGATRKQLLFGPDSPLPSVRDFKDFFAMLRWFVGLGPKPSFDRWTYWEKFDFWGAAGDVMIIGFTGLVLWFPNFFCQFLPGTAINVAHVIHSTQALLATGFVFAIHFFNTHLRPEKFPADMSVFTGLVSDDELRAERPELYERLQQRGELEQLRVAAPRNRSLWVAKISGFVALALGLALLAGMVVAGLGG